MRRSSQLGMSGLFVLAWCLAAPARAESPSTGASSAGSSSAGAEAAAPSALGAPGQRGPEQEAEALLVEAKELFRRGEYRQALPLVKRAYSLVESPRYLFNLGVLHHKLSECVPAREHFELYLLKAPAGEGRAQALTALEELRARCPSPGAPSQLTQVGAPVLVAPAQRVQVASAMPAAAPPLRLERVALERDEAPGGAALVLLGVGAAAGASAIAALVAKRHAESEIDALGSEAARQDAVWDEREGRRRDLAANARLYRGLSLGLGVACAAFAGAGTTLWILEASDGAGALPVAAGVSYRGRF